MVPVHTWSLRNSAVNKLRRRSVDQQGQGELWVDWETFSSSDLKAFRESDGNSLTGLVYNVQLSRHDLLAPPMFPLALML
jgi:hypothetical protein